MKKIKSICLLIVACFFTVSLLQAQPTQFEWAVQFGGTSNDIGTTIAVDQQENVFTAGDFNGSADFDPGPGTAILTSLGSGDIYLTKLDSAGQFIWVKHFGGVLTQSARGLVIDNTGNVILTGIFRNTVDFDPGPGQLLFTAVQNDDIFIVKLDNSGNLVWARQIGNTSVEIVDALAADAAGNIFCLGHFMNSIDVDPTAGVYNLTSAGLEDLFIVKLNSQGNFGWALSMGGPATESPISIQIDGPGNVYTTGYFRDTSDFDPSTISVFNLICAGMEDVFISRLDTGGNFVWAKRVGGTAGDVGKRLSVDASGNVLVCGYFNGTVDFDPGAGTTNLTSSSRDAFILKLNSSGNFNWAHRFGGNNNDNAFALDVNAAGDVFCAGTYSGGMDLDPGTGNSYVPDFGGGDAWITRLDSNGIFIWGGHVGGAAGFDYPNGFSVHQDVIYLTGVFTGAASLNPNSATFNYTSFGGEDAFVIKLRNSSANGIIEQYLSGKINLYPNPANQSAVISWHPDGSGAESKKTELKIFDVTGKEMLKQEVSGQRSEIDVSKFENGIYFVQLTSLSPKESVGVRSQKFIVQH